MNANAGTTSDCGRLLQIVSTVCPLQRSLMKKSFVSTEGFPQTSIKWRKYEGFPGRQTFQTKGCCVTCCGRTQRSRFRGGVTMTVACHSHLVTMSLLHS